ncbi:hypothetical protein, partial [Acidiferrobacter sp.]|uniref:hypothetical protein n=1 Tax=Acidiferrobacter sp. TaxID=1872107 RepID=UPI0026283272
LTMVFARRLLMKGIRKSELSPGPLIRRSTKIRVTRLKLSDQRSTLPAAHCRPNGLWPVSLRWALDVARVSADAWGKPGFDNVARLVMVFYVIELSLPLQGD